MIYHGENIMLLLVLPLLANPILQLERHDPYIPGLGLILKPT